tara:strand:+ start:192 stop:590 length:399 start_codon:yes stop_codon:yes gene_type:complete
MDSNEIRKKRYYIYENISKIKNHTQIIDLIVLKECKFTENNNGIFLNLSVLDSEIITSIYQIIVNSLNYEEQNCDHLLQEMKEEVKEEVKEKVKGKGKQQKKQTKEETEILSIKEFKKKEQPIVIHSKKYKL